MRADEIREMAKDGHRRRASRSCEEERFRLTFRGATEPLEDPLRLRVIRRDIARLKTVLRGTAGAMAETTNGRHDSNETPALTQRAQRGRRGRVSS